MHVGIIQSNYIPWRGFFDFIDDVELFVILDDVQYSKGTWRNRNKVKLPGGSQWITVPVSFQLRDRTLIENTEINYRRPWREEHLKLLSLAYASAPYFQRYIRDFEKVLASHPRTISELNVALIRWVCELLSIRTKILMSRDLGAAGHKTDRVLDILSRVGATSYLSGRAAEGYLETEKFQQRNIALYYKEYDYPAYPQLFGDFDGVVTVLDLLFNCGPDSRRFLKSRTANKRYVFGGKT